MHRTLRTAATLARRRRSGHLSRSVAIDPSSPAMTDTLTLRRTPLYESHVRLGARLVPFAGWEMPVQYAAGISAEHRAVREACGLFDVSHMGEVIVRGPDAIAFVNHVTSNDVAALAVGQIQYSTLLTERGTIVDDLLVYRAPDHLFLVVNAGNRDADLAHLRAHLAGFDATLEDVSDRYALIAVQGPDAPAIVQRLTATDLAPIKYYRFVEGEVAGVPAIISRTGYTGELGFELYVPWAQAVTVWDALLAGGGVTPCGLGARDTLRLEAGMALYGHELDIDTTPLEAGLGWLVKLGKADFLGKAVLVRQHQDGVDRKLVGFTFDERAIPRHGMPVWYGDLQVGTVCSGTMSPTLAEPIGTCYLPGAAAVPGTRFEVDIRGRRVPARVVSLPFYQRAGRA
jgi:aminomethyltransferase